MKWTVEGYLRQQEPSWAPDGKQCQERIYQFKRKWGAERESRVVGRDMWISQKLFLDPIKRKSVSREVRQYWVWRHMNSSELVEMALCKGCWWIFSMATTRACLHCGPLGKQTSVFVPSKNNLTEIKISQGLDWASPSLSLIFSWPVTSQILYFVTRWPNIESSFKYHYQKAGLCPS